VDTVIETYLNTFRFDRLLPISKQFEPFRQKTLRPKLTPAEGFILGVGAKMFTIAGPVIVYGVSASVVYGFVYWLIQKISGG
jgi:hypothetical protein